MNEFVERTGNAENFSKGDEIAGFLSDAFGTNAVVNRTQTFSFTLKP